MNLGFGSGGGRPRSLELEFLGSHRTFAVTDAPSRNADSKAKIVWVGPPILENRCVRNRPGKRRVGDTKMICRDGCGRTSRYCFV